MNNKKIKTREEIKEIVDSLKKKDKNIKIVTANGSFDLLHIGHIKFLQEAKQQGDVLVVGINSDASIKKYKSKDRPLVPEKYREEMLAALECVDYVVIFDEENPIPLLEAIKPDVHVNGEEYGEDCIEAPIVKKHGGRVHLVKKFGDFSTTNLIERVKRLG